MTEVHLITKCPFCRKWHCIAITATDCAKPEKKLVPEAKR